MLLSGEWKGYNSVSNWDAPAEAKQKPSFP
jgi:hypothetical protein